MGAWNGLWAGRAIFGIVALALGWSRLPRGEDLERSGPAIVALIVPVALVARLYGSRTLKPSASVFARVRRLSFVSGVLILGAFALGVIGGPFASRWLALPMALGVGAMLVSDGLVASAPPEAFETTPSASPTVLAVGWLVAIAAAAALVYVAVYWTESR